MYFLRNAFQLKYVSYAIQHNMIISERWNHFRLISVNEYFSTLDSGFVQITCLERYLNQQSYLNIQNEIIFDSKRSQKIVISSISYKGAP